MVRQLRKKRAKEIDTTGAAAMMTAIINMKWLCRKSYKAMVTPKRKA
jgi:hypothetical protein